MLFSAGIQTPRAWKGFGLAIRVFFNSFKTQVVLDSLGYKKSDVLRKKKFTLKALSWLPSLSDTL